MDVREKLVELVHNARMNALWHNAPNPSEYITDMLMEDGVTVQEWISVKDERKPKAGEDVLVVVFDGYYTYTDTDCLMRDGRWCYETENHKVTHWQPMPQPPKGE